MRMHPRVKVSARIDVDAKQHQAVLRSTVLRTLAEIEAGVVRVDPRVVDAIGNQVRLSRKARHPEAVIRVRGEKFQERWRRIRRIADRDVKFVRGDDAEIGIAELPPELMANRGDVDCARRRRCVLNLRDHTRGGKEQHDDDQDRNHSPREFDLIAAVDLSGLVRIVIRFRTIANDRVDEQGKHRDEDRARDGEHKERDAVDVVGRRRFRLEDIRDERRIVRFGRYHKGAQQNEKRC